MLSCMILSIIVYLMNIQTTNPATEHALTSYRAMAQHEVQKVIEQGQKAFLSWRETSFGTRVQKMKEAAGLLRARADEYAALMAREMGKPVSQGKSECEKCAWVCEYYAEHASVFLSPEHVETEATRSYVTYLPLGMILAVMPWNFPFWQVFRFAAPALMAGNSCVLKHASNVTGCALNIEKLFVDAGFPENLFSALLIPSSDVETVIANPLIRGITLTGSGPAGRAVAGAAGRALKKTVMELGGSDAYLILRDADLEKAADICAKSRILNSGQSCIAAKRFIVEAPVLKKFEELLTEKMGVMNVGDPLLEETEVGPLARRDLREELHEQVQKSIHLGACCLLGGEIPEGKGYYYPPTVLTGVHKGMPVFDEETFGPVAAIVSVQTEEEAIELANSSIFGLGAAVFTKDRERGEKIASKRLEAGLCFVNEFVKSDPRLPFGGVKESGYGRELFSFGMREFLNIKTVVVN